MLFLKLIYKILKTFFKTILLIIAIPVLFLLAVLTRFVKKPVDIGLGPEPMINNVYHKKALQYYGFKAETFVNSVYYITDQFDIRGDLKFKGPLSILRDYCLFIMSIFRYKCLYIYFNGGTLGFRKVLWRIEPLLYRVANVKVVIMPYGGDIQDLSRCPNLLFKHAMSRDYPNFKNNRKLVSKKIDLWTKYANHIIGGCDWVDYMYYWDTLMLGHFSIDTDLWCSQSLVNQSENPQNTSKKTIKILHAPNHRTIKGSSFFVEAIDELKTEGLDIELIIAEKVSNEEIRKLMTEVDIVADQLIVGWYAMFAIEAMSMGKPVLCYLRSDLEELYINAGIVKKEEIPIINCKPDTVKDRIRELAINPHMLKQLGERSREYAIKHHSVEFIGGMFKKINDSIGISREGN
ncbi:MAG: hypothetical protein Q8920_02765 [Bacillota bacterium]|nr:hypothetical protein [Bacillota bacterium]